jgi:urease accessory protein
MALTTLLLLSDSRLPAGGHAHSGGIEAAAATGRVHDTATLHAFLRGRLHTTGYVAAAFAAAACHATLSVGNGPLLGQVSPADNEERMAELDDGMDARTASAALRKASRGQGRALLRAGRSMWTLPRPPMADPHHAVALGAVASAAGVPPEQAALAAAYGSISGPAGAAVRVLALDPYPVHTLLAGLADECDDVAARAAVYKGLPVDELPATSAPLLDLSAEAHATWEVRLFAS